MLAALLAFLLDLLTAAFKAVLPEVFKRADATPTAEDSGRVTDAELGPDVLDRVRDAEDDFNSSWGAGAGGPGRG